jgi:hypothetical protein
MMEWQRKRVQREACDTVYNEWLWMCWWFIMMIGDQVADDKAVDDDDERIGLLVRLRLSRVMVTGPWLTKLLPTPNTCT